MEGYKERYKARMLSEGRCVRCAKPKEAGVCLSCREYFRQRHLASYEATKRGRYNGGGNDLQS